MLSEAFKELLVESYGVRPELVHVVRPGVDVERFSPGDRRAARRQLGIDAPDDRPVAVTARRLVPRMGIDVLLAAWSQVVEARGSSARPLLLVVGDGEQRAALETQAARLGLAQDVRFLGKVSDDDLVAAYRAADVAVAPSVALEGFGLVVLEALACGTPVVGSAVAGLREALEGFDGGPARPAGRRGGAGRPAARRVRGAGAVAGALPGLCRGLHLAAHCGRGDGGLPLGRGSIARAVHNPCGDDAADRAEQVALPRHAGRRDEAEQQRRPVDREHEQSDGEVEPAVRPCEP